MKYDFIIFGGTGLQGRICARDLLESGYSVLLVGRDKRKIKNLLKNKKVKFIEVDLRNPKKIFSVIKKSRADVVINCAEYTFNLNIANACLKLKKSLTDLGALEKTTKEQLNLDVKFKKLKIVNIIGCGSTPGIANIMARYATEKLDSVETIDLGFAWDSNIKKFVIPYSMQSIFHEFTEDPITFHNGRFIREKRVTCKGTKNFFEVGRQDVYCIVHPEIYTFAKYFKNKGIKNVHYFAGFPEHSMKVIQTLIDLGFHSEKKINIKGIEISPIEFTNSVLKKITVPKNYKEYENIWVNVYGKKNSKNVKIDMNCIVKTLKGWEDAGSNVGTGRTISIISQMLKKKQIQETGVLAPEAVVPIKPFFKELAKRGMHVYENYRKIN